MNWATFSGRDVAYGGLEHLVPELCCALLVPRGLSKPLKLPQTLSCFQRHVLHVPVIRLDVSQHVSAQVCWYKSLCEAISLQGFSKVWPSWDWCLRTAILGLLWLLDPVTFS